MSSPPSTVASLGVPPTDPIVLNHYLTEVRGKTICTSLAYNIVQKISYVALIAIGTFAFFISSGAVAMTSTLSTIGLGMIPAFLFFFWLASVTSSALKENAQSNEIESHIIATLRDMRADYQTANPNSSEEEADLDYVTKFFNKQNIDLNQIPKNVLAALEKQSPDKNPLCALLPLIIRFEYLDKAIRPFEKICEAIEATIEKKEKELADKSEPPLGKEIKENYRLVMRENAHARMESQALIDVFEAAFCLKVLRNPTFNLSLSDIGTFVPKTFARREFERRYEPKDDHYFVFKDASKAPITLDEVLVDPTPKAIYTKFFV